MFEGLSELIESHNIQANQLKSIEGIMSNFNNIKMPSLLQYMQLVQTLNEILENSENE